MNRLSKNNTDKRGYLLCLILGFILIFIVAPVFSSYALIVNIVGFILLMYGIYGISRKIKNRENTTDD